MTDAMDLVQEAFFAAAKGDAPLSGRITDAGGRFGWFLSGGIPGGFGLSETVAAVTVDAETAVGGGDKEEITLLLTVNAHKHSLAKAVTADLLRLFHAGGGKQWRPLALTEGHAGFVRREFADWANDPTSETVRRTLRFRVLVGRPRAA